MRATEPKPGAWPRSIRSGQPKSAVIQISRVVGKREYLEPYHYEVAEQISELRGREKAAVRAAKEKLERRVFGLSASASSNPAQVVSFRDAQARARQLEDRDDAEQIYQSALRSGDDVLAAAILERALVRGWTSIREDFLSRNAGTRDALDDLAALAQYENNSLLNAVHYMPPMLGDFPRSAGMTSIPNLHSRDEPRGVVRPLRDGFGNW